MMVRRERKDAKGRVSTSFLQTTSRWVYGPQVLLSRQLHVHRSPLTEPMLIAPDIDRIIEMAWEDRTPFKAIEQ